MPPQNDLGNGLGTLIVDPPPPKVTKRPVQLGVPLTDLDAAWRLAQNMAMAQNVGKEIRGNAADIFLVFMWGAELQIGPAQALANIKIFNGQPTLMGQLLSALVRRAGHDLEEVENTWERATIRLTRADTGRVWESTFTVEDAIRGKLLHRRDDGSLVARSQNGKDLPWMLWTPDMLYWRALGRVVRRGASEATLGCAIEGEIEDDAPMLTQMAEKAPEVTEPTADDILAEVKQIENIGAVPAADMFTFDTTEAEA